MADQKTQNAGKLIEAFETYFREFLWMEIRPDDSTHEKHTKRAICIQVIPICARTALTNLIKAGGLSDTQAQMIVRLCVDVQKLIDVVVD